MEIEVLKSSKNHMEFKVDNVTLAELLRVYLNEESSVKLAVWKREHPSEKPIVKVKTKRKSAKKVVKDAISSAVKELEGVGKDFSKLK